MSRSQRLAFAAIAAVIAVVAVVVLTSGGDDEEAATTPNTVTEAGTPPSQQEEEATVTPEPEEAEPADTPQPEEQIEVKGGEVVGGEAEIRAKQGGRVRFSVTSDAPDHVHLHGYDVMKDVAPGKPASFDVKAEITGIFEVELEDAGLQIASVRVDP